MLDGLRLYGRYIDISFRSQMQYRASFVMLSVGHGLMTGLEFLGIWVLFDRFAALDTWSLPEVAFFYGLINIAFALCDAFSRGFDLFASTVKSGDFDRLLLRPRSTALQLAGQELTLKRIGRLTQGLVVLLWAAHALDLTWTPDKLLLALLTVLGGACLFYGLIVLQATLAFWTTESLEIVNTVTYGGVETAQYPLAIYRAWFRRFFTYVIPLACVSYYPALGILERPDPLGSGLLFQWLAPVALFFAVCLRVWQVRHYRSTGSIWPFWAPNGWPRSWDCSFLWSVCASGKWACGTTALREADLMIDLADDRVGCGTCRGVPFTGLTRSRQTCTFALRIGGTKWPHPPSPNRLHNGDALLLDRLFRGGTSASELQRRGADVLKGAEDRLKAWSATANLEYANVVQQVHSDYLRVGA